MIFIVCLIIIVKIILTDSFRRESPVEGVSRTLLTAMAGLVFVDTAPLFVCSAAAFPLMSNAPFGVWPLPRVDWRSELWWTKYSYAAFHTARAPRGSTLGPGGTPGAPLLRLITWLVPWVRETGRTKTSTFSCTLHGTMLRLSTVLQLYVIKINIDYDNNVGIEKLT